MERISHSLVQTLRAIPDFSALDDETLLLVVGESMNLFWKAGSAIFKPGDPGTALYVVLSGEVAIHDGDHPGLGDVARIETGDFFGEMSLLLNTTHRRTATVMSDCEILVLPKDAFTTVLENNPALAEHFDGIMKTKRGDFLSRAAGS
jgi:CRP-like cAMP-binding protein